MKAEKCLNELIQEIPNDQRRKQNIKLMICGGHRHEDRAFRLWLTCATIVAIMSIVGYIWGGQ